MDLAAYGKSVCEFFSKNPLAVDAVYGIASIPIAKLAIWGSRKVSDILNDYDQGSWKHTALKIARNLLFVIGTMATIDACVGIGIAVSAVVGFSVTSLTGLPALGIAAGVGTGLTAIAIAFKEFLRCIYGVDLEWLDRKELNFCLRRPAANISKA